MRAATREFDYILTGERDTTFSISPTSHPFPDEKTDLIPRGAQGEFVLKIHPLRARRETLALIHSDLGAGAILAAPWPGLVRRPLTDRRSFAKSTSGGGYECIGPAEGAAPRLDIRASKSGVLLTVSVANEGGASVRFDPAALLYGWCELVCLMDGDRVQRIEKARIALGRLIGGHRFAVRAEELRDLSPGSVESMLLPLPKELEGLDALEVRFVDEFPILTGSRPLGWVLTEFRVQASGK